MKSYLEEAARAREADAQARREYQRSMNALSRAVLDAHALASGMIIEGAAYRRINADGTSERVEGKDFARLEGKTP